MAFDDETIDVLIGGYLSKDAALEDCESVLGCGGYLHGAVVAVQRSGPERASSCTTARPRSWRSRPGQPSRSGELG